MKVESHHLMDIARMALSELGISNYEELELTFRAKEGTEWRVNFSFKRPPNTYTQKGAFAVDDETGEVRVVGLNRAWS